MVSSLGKCATATHHGWRQQPKPNSPVPGWTNFLRASHSSVRLYQRWRFDFTWHHASADHLPAPVDFSHFLQVYSKCSLTSLFLRILSRLLIQNPVAEQTCQQEQHRACALLFHRCGRWTAISFAKSRNWDLHKWVTQEHLERSKADLDRGPDSKGHITFFCSLLAGHRGTMLTALDPQCYPAGSHHPLICPDHRKHRTVTSGGDWSGIVTVNSHVVSTCPRTIYSSDLFSLRIRPTSLVLGCL